MMKYVLSAVLLACIFAAPACDQIPAQINVTELKAVIVTFEASPSVIKPGETTYLQWKVTGTNTVTIDNGIGTVAVNGSVPVMPSASTYYTITAANSAGTSTARTQVLVTTMSQSSGHPSAPSIRSFTAGKTVVAQGEAVELNWEVTDAIEIILSNYGRVAAKDKMTVNPAVTTTYVLTASNNYSQVSQSVIVLVRNAQGGRDPVQQFVKLPVLLDESGSVVKASSSYTYQKGICAGDTPGNFAQRAFLSFDISSVPETAVIQEAILDLSSASKSGNPSYAVSIYGNMGALEIYHFQYGTTVDLNTLAYNRAARLVENGRFTSYPLSPWTLDVKNSNDGEAVVQGLVQTHQNRLQLRIQFFTSTNWNSETDGFCFENAILTVKYAVP
jgi:hypothetical protein